MHAAGSHGGTQACRAIEEAGVNLLVRLLVLVAMFTACALIAAPSYAQTGTGLSGALQALQDKKGGLPAGWTARIGKTKTGAMGETDGTTKTITIDPDAIRSVSPSLGSYGSNVSSILYVVLLHEWYHAKEIEGGTGTGGSGQDGGAGGGLSGTTPPYNTVGSPCGELRMIPGVAREQCQMICDLRAAGIGVSFDCALYNDVRRKYNKKGSAQWSEHCAGSSGTPVPYPGPIPPCECCP